MAAHGGVKHEPEFVSAGEMMPGGKKARQKKRKYMTPEEAQAIDQARYGQRRWPAQ